MDIDVKETTGSGSREAAHPSLSLHIRTICTGAFKRVILSMQSRCHAVSVCYTSVETANLLPHILMNTHACSASYEVPHLFEIWTMTLSSTTLSQKSQRKRNERHNPTFSIIKHCCESAFKVLVLMLF